MGKLSKRPIIFSLTATLVFVFILALPFENFLEKINLSTIQADLLADFLKNLFIITLATIVIKKIHIFELSGLGKQSPCVHKFLVIIPIYLLIIGICQLQRQDLSEISSLDIILLLLSTLSIGFSEEFVFRGLIQSIFIQKYINKKYGILISILIPSVLFGLLHLLNFKLANVAAEISQLLYAIFFGVFFGAVLLKTNRLVPLALMHGLIDFVFGFDSLISNEANESESALSAIVSLIVVLPLFIVGLQLIKRIKAESIKVKIALSSNE